MFLIPSEVDNAEKMLRNSIKRKNDKSTEFAMVFDQLHWILDTISADYNGYKYNKTINHIAYRYITQSYNGNDDNEKRTGQHMNSI